jgi:putative phosphoesterase
MSDSHDNIETIRKAIELFNDRKVSTVIHAGDLVSPFTVRLFRDLKCPMHLILGNNDGDPKAISKFFEGVGEYHGQVADLVIHNRRIGVTHGHLPLIKKLLLETRKFDVVITGHTHVKSEERIEATLLINPGEACGYLTGEASVVILDLETLSSEFIVLDQIQNPLTQ